MQNSSLIDLVYLGDSSRFCLAPTALISGDLLGSFREKESKDLEVSFAEPESVGYSPHVFTI